MERKLKIHKSTRTIDTLQLTHWYQPIIQLETGSLFGYEALVRDESIHGLSPIDIFKFAELENCRNNLDRRLLFKAFNLMKNMNARMSFFNIFPSTLLQSGFLYWWNKNIAGNSSIVLEISESEPVSDWNKLKLIITELHNQGVKIAVDDMGAGYSFFQHWIELNPDYIKIDRYYAVNLAQSILKQRVLNCLIKLFDDSTKVILEGIETIEDLNIAKSLGIPYAQGFLLGKPLAFEHKRVVLRNSKRDKINNSI